MRRFAVFALLAIVLPSGIVAVLGYVSLRQWERSAELLFREQARDVAAMAVDKLGMMLRHAEDELVARLQASLDGAADREQAVTRFLAETSLVQRLYLFDRRGRLRYPAAPHDGDAEIFAALLAEVSQGFWDRGGRRDLVTGQTTALAAILTLEDGPVLAALVRSLDGLRREIFDKTLKGLESPAICAIVDGTGRPVYAQGPLDGADLVTTIPFRDGFPTWRLAIYQAPGTSPASSVRRQVAVFTGALAVLILVIATGVVVTWRLVRRETEMARLKADFVANVSHDLKTPLSVIRMFGETLEMGRVRDEAARQEYYRVITRESERLSRLIENVLDFSRLEGGRQRHEIAPTAVEPLVRETLEAFAYPLGQAGFKVDVTVAPDVAEVLLDAGAVAQALSNLVDNAIKYSAERKTLRVEARIVEGQLALSVADEGVGIPREEHERIFQKFYRVGRSETQTRRGSGVGLALVRHVAEAHGGRITVESRPGEGSRFTLWIPVGPR